MKTVIQQQGGITETLIDGQPVSRVWARGDNPGRLAVEKLEEYRPAGIDCFITIADDFYTIGWDGADDYDYRITEQHIDRLVRTYSKVKLILFVGIASGVPYRWAKAHTDQLAVTHRGDPINMPCMASALWRRDFDGALQRYVEYFENGPYRDNILGYNPHRNANEWFAYDMTRRGSAEGTYLDYNPLMAEQFRGWLREVYGNDVERLREAWRDKAVTFDDAAIPTPAQRRGVFSESMFSAEGPDGRRAADWYLCYNQANADDAIACCRAIKQVVGRRKLVGVMHGYADVGSMSSVPAEFGHLAADRIANSEHIDFVHGPHAYYNRDPADGFHISRFATAHLQRRKCLVIDQFDFGTHLVPGDDGAPSEEHAVNQIMRGVGHNLQSHGTLYWYEGGPGTYSNPHGPCEWGLMHYDHPTYQDLIVQTKKLFDENQKQAHANVAETALILSPGSVAELALRHSKAAASLFSGYFRSIQMSRLGAPFDEYLLEDFGVIDRPYKLYIFAGCFRVDESTRRQIHERLAADEATAVWVGPAGYINGAGTASHDATEALTGMRVRREHDTPDGLLQVDITDDGHALTAGLAPGERSFGNVVDAADLRRRGGFLGCTDDYRLRPAISVDDADARPLGRLRGFGSVGLAEKQMDGWRSVYAAAPMPPAALLRSALTTAGGHVYSEAGDLIYANAGFVCITSRGEGTRRIQLPQQQNLSDAMTGESVGRSVRTLTLEMPYGQTRLLRREASG
jgi:hypothetical protein